MAVGQPFVNFMAEHHPETCRRLTQSEALELLDAEHKRGHLHSAWFKDACLDRFYVICNCCKCCCGGVEAMVSGNPMFASSGFVAKVNHDLCGQCGSCVEACPFAALSLETSVEMNWEKCMGCGVCEGLCPNGATSLVRDEKKGIPLDVRLLTQETTAGS
jgi:NAD-dependent dihydropyrimidine dehydrogenase PreA subunit